MMGIRIDMKVRCPDSMYAETDVTICKACMWFRGIEDEYVMCEKAKPYEELGPELEVLEGE